MPVLYSEHVSPYKDALQRRAVTQLESFLDWCEREGALGAVTEVGWPNDLQRSKGDVAQWDALAEQWYRLADKASLLVTAFSADEQQVFGGYSLNIYTSVGDGSTRAISQAQAQATTFEAHGTTASWKRGLHISSADYTQGGFSNASPGTFNTDYWYPSRATYDYLYGRGVRYVRLPFRWERIQPTLAAALSSTEVTRLTDSITQAGLAGLGVILDCHNYAEYIQSVSGTPTVRHLGSANLTTANFVDLWTQLSTSFKSNVTVYAYDLMNEPDNMVPGSGQTQATYWESVTQQVVTAIRNNVDTKLILLPGYQQSVERWTQNHARKWITDTANNHYYCGHQYFWVDGWQFGGNYSLSYEEERLNAQRDGWRA